MVGAFEVCLGNRNFHMRVFGPTDLIFLRKCLLGSWHQSRGQSKRLDFHIARPYTCEPVILPQVSPGRAVAGDMSASLVADVAIEEDNSATRDSPQLPSGDDEQGSNICTSVDGEFSLRSRSNF